MTVIQICGCTQDEHGVEPFVSDQVAGFYGVYIGEPGDFMWKADFDEKHDAMTFARTLADTYGYEIDDMTFRSES